MDYTPIGVVQHFWNISNQIKKKFTTKTLHNFTLTINKYLKCLNIFLNMNFPTGQIRLMVLVVVNFTMFTLNTTHIIFMNIKYLNICPSKLYKYHKEKHGKSCSSKFYFSMPNDVRYWKKSFYVLGSHNEWIKQKNVI
jgi:hypothetical protein